MGEEVSRHDLRVVTALLLVPLSSLVLLTTRILFQLNLQNGTSTGWVADITFLVCAPIFLVSTIYAVVSIIYP